MDLMMLDKGQIRPTDRGVIRATVSKSRDAMTAGHRPL